MKRIVSFEQSKFPKMMGEFNHSQQVMKVFSLCSLVLVLLSLVCFSVYFSQGPVVLNFNSEGEIVSSVKAPKLEKEIQSGVKYYLEHRYNWNPINVKKKLSIVESFIHPSSLKAFSTSVSNVSRFSTEKSVSQRVYSNTLKVNLANKTVFIKGDRITEIQGLKAAGNLDLELSFDYGPRSLKNPWGLFITKEKENL